MSTLYTTKKSSADWEPESEDARDARLKASRKSNTLDKGLDFVVADREEEGGRSRAGVSAGNSSYSPALC